MRQIAVGGTFVFRQFRFGHRARHSAPVMAQRVHRSRKSWLGAAALAAVFGQAGMLTAQEAPAPAPAPAPPAAAPAAPATTPPPAPAATSTPSTTPAPAAPPVAPPGRRT